MIVNAADEPTTRSKVFAEIATAMWASRFRQPPEYSLCSREQQMRDTTIEWTATTPQ
ncbi:hypothetical protein ACFXO7_00920 [Nocardia tengchongensis]|uniref:hypothetical protein n=1 Tax=Nocardia tengchongensis TaxID=2055889 RepID=UPI0036A8070F